MSTLIAKELRQLLPIAALWLALMIFGYLSQLAGARIDEQSFASWCAEYCQPGLAVGVVLFTVGLVLITAYSLFPREYDEATIDFLRSLPISAADIFLAKFLAAWLLLCTLYVSGFLLDTALLWMNPQGIDGRAYPVTALHFLLRDMLFLFVVLAHGIFISWFRTLGLILYVAYLVAIVWAETRLGSSGVWNVLRMLENEFDGQTLIVNFTTIATHVSVAIVLLWISFHLWRNQETHGRGKQRRRSMPRWLAISGNSLAFMLVAGLLLGYLQMATQDGEAGGSLEKRSTQHYRFTFNDAQQETLEYLARHADDDLERLADLLGAEGQLVIDADLTAQSDHVLGLAQWKRVNMVVSGFEPVEKYRRVLSHETVHVFQAVESDRALAEHGNATGFFIEGMAQYLSFQLVPEAERLQWNRQVAAVAWRRQRIRFDDLIDDAGFTRRFDQDLYYSMGELWTAALVDACGEAALGRLLRSAGRDGASRSLSGAGFWRDTLQVAGCELESVNATWRERMQNEFETVNQAAFPAFAGVRVDSSNSNGTVVLRADVANGETVAATQKAQPSDTPQARKAEIPQTGKSPGPTRWLLHVASETSLAAGVPQVYYGKRLETGSKTFIEYQIPRSALTGKRFRYQIGYTPHTESRAYFEKWQSAATGR